jgi:hypothetical protein
MVACAQNIDQESSSGRGMRQFGQAIGDTTKDERRTTNDEELRPVRDA